MRMHKLLEHMITVFFKISSNNFTKLLNRLDEQRKIHMKVVKDLVKINKDQKEKTSGCDENDTKTWEVKIA